MPGRLEASVFFGQNWRETTARRPKAQVFHDVVSDRTTQHMAIVCLHVPRSYNGVFLLQQVRRHKRCWADVEQHLFPSLVFVSIGVRDHAGGVFRRQSLYTFDDMLLRSNALPFLCAKLTLQNRRAVTCAPSSSINVISQSGTVFVPPSVSHQMIRLAFEVAAPIKYHNKLHILDIHEKRLLLPNAYYINKATRCDIDVRICWSAQ